MKLKVGVVYGGKSGEHDVSLQSARSIMEAMNPEKYEIHPFFIDRRGNWFYREKEKVYLSLDTEEKGFVKATSGEFIAIDVVFPVLHGPYGEDGTIQGLLEMAGIPYVGAGVLASAAGMDKGIMKALFARAGLPQVKYTTVYRYRLEEAIEEEIKRVKEEIGFPCFVKPANLGSSVGISKVKREEELLPALQLAARYDAKIIVEQGLEGVREVEVGVLGNYHPQASVVGEIIPSNEFYDYQAKYIDGRSQLLIPAPLPEERAEEIRKMAIVAFKAVEGSGLGRVDFFLTGEGKIYVNEINTMPGFTRYSMYPKLWEATGLPYSELIDRLIQLAQERFADRSRNAV